MPVYTVFDPEHMLPKKANGCAHALKFARACRLALSQRKRYWRHGWRLYRRHVSRIGCACMGRVYTHAACHAGSLM
jgi:hypothetical protein